nr:MAG TPA: RNA dependent RNA polymerase [Caudoviricetes sp.]
MTNKYGVRIKNFSAGQLYEYNLGARDYLPYTNAMLTNSLFLDFLLENGLKVSKNGFTRDVICLNFDMGAKSYEDTRGNIVNKIKETDDEEKIKRLEFLLNKVDENRDKYVKKRKEDIRIEYYEHGIDIKYRTKDKAGNIKKTETVHYKMLYRSAGKAKQGSVMFICSRLYKKAHDFIYMGLKMPKHNAPIVEASAYVSLIASTIVGRMRIEPENILILKDVDSFFRREVVSIGIDEKKHCYAKRIQDYELKNTLFDGQALIDDSIFPKWAEGYVLLRHHMTKCAAFHTNIQQFFKDWYGDEYESAKVVDMWGNEHYAKDIKMITTDNATKFLKFGISYEYWCKKVHENGCQFGIVKTAHKSKYGDVQRMSYQMINTLDVGIMDGVLARSKSYVEQLKSDNKVFLDYLRDNENFSNDYEVLVALCEQDSEFVRSEYFRSRKKKIIDGYVKNLKFGKVLQEGDNLVMVGSPYAMLLHSVGEDVEKDNTFNQEQDCIQCYTKRFGANEYLAGFRSPHNSKSNILALHNVGSEVLDKYFHIGEQCVAVNCQHTDISDRANGADFDSDMIFTTNQPDIAQYAKQCYLNNPTVVNNVPKEKNHYDYSLYNHAIIDNNLARSQMSIGESSNIAQLALTYSYTFTDKNYLEYADILACIAQICIDNSKRRYDIDLNSEIRRIKSELDVKTHGYPRFWLYVNYATPKDKINNILQCPMNVLFDYKPPKIRSNESTLPMCYFYNHHQLKEDRRKSKKVEAFIEAYGLRLYQNAIDDIEDDLILREDFENMVEDIKRVYISKDYLGLFSWLIDRAFHLRANLNGNGRKSKAKTDKNKVLLLKTLYTINPSNLLKIFQKTT